MIISVRIVFFGDARTNNVRYPSALTSYRHEPHFETKQNQPDVLPHVGLRVADAQQITRDLRRKLTHGAGQARTVLQY